MPDLLLHVIKVFEILNVAVSNETSRRWEVSDHFDVMGQTSTEITLNPTNSGDGYVTYVASNSCGETVHCKSVYVSGFSTCGPGIISFPGPYSCGPEGSQNFAMTSSNPSAGEITIEAEGLSTYISENSLESPEVELYDFANNRVYHKTMNRDKHSIRTNKLKKGMHVLLVREKGKIVWRKTVVIE